MAQAKYDGNCWRCDERFIAFVSTIHNYEGEWVCDDCLTVLIETEPAPPKPVVKCTSRTKAGKRCGINAEPHSDKCHVHDPAGTFQQQQKAKR